MITTNVTNYRKQTIVIHKINESTRETTQARLSGAWFKLLKYGTSDYELYLPTADYQQSVDPQNQGRIGKATDGEGTLSFENLPDGEYQIVETKTPAGYIKVENNNLYFRVEKGVVTRYNKGYGENDRSVIYSTVSVNNSPQPVLIASISYEFDPDNAEATFTVGNNPGVSLPATGGSGTTLYYIAGSALLLLALALLLRRRRDEA